MQLLTNSEEILGYREIVSANGQVYDVVTRSYACEEPMEDWVWYITRLHPRGTPQVTLRSVYIHSDTDLAEAAHYEMVGRALAGAFTGEMEEQDEGPLLQQLRAVI